MKHPLLSTTALATVVWLTGAAQAQDSQQEPADTPAGAAMQEAPAEDAGAATQEAPVEDTAAPQEAAETASEEEMEGMDQAAGPFLTTQDEQEYRAANVIGMSVINDQDETIGEIDDIILDADDKVVGVLVSVGGFLGIGEKWVGLPIEEIEINEDQETASAQFASDQLENAPDFATKEDQEAEQQAEEAQQQMNQPVPSPAPGTETAPAQ